MAVSKVELANGEVLMDLTGDSVTPDTLAEGETAHDATGEPIVGRMKSGGGASVQSDWNQTDETAADFIKNKPISVVGSGTIKWDGDTTGREYVDMGDGAVLVHVSDATPNIDDFANGGSFKMVIPDGEVTVPFTGGDIMDTGIGCIIGPNAGFGVTAVDGLEVEGLFFPVKGVYFIASASGGVNLSELVINGYSGFISETLAPDYLPQIPADKLKEITAVNLNADSDKYLYKPGTDTSDTNNRITQQELLNFFSDGRIVYVSPNISQYFLAVDATFLSGVGKLTTTGGMFYTAEYTP
jgi:hypothetical protein